MNKTIRVRGLERKIVIEIKMNIIQKMKYIEKIKNKYR